MHASINSTSALVIGLVGPCGAGKSTLAGMLRARGYTVRHIAQEHSYVKDMWQRIAKPDVLIFLNATYATTKERRQFNWEESDYAEQQRRLAHAREHAHLLVQTDALNPEDALDQILKYLASL
jgi:guanylate kinase